MLLLSILLLGVWQAGKGIVSSAKIERDRNDLNAVAQACRQYFQKEGHWPNQASDLQPFFVNLQLDPRKFSLNPQDNLIQIVTLQDNITVLKPAGLAARLDYK